MAGHLEHLNSVDGVAPYPGLSLAVSGRGRVVMASGQVAFDDGGNIVGPGDARAQTRQVFENLRRVLAAAGASFEDVAKLTYYLTDMRWLPVVREVRDEFVNTADPPASSAVQVVALAVPELLVEIEAMAIVEEAAG